MKIDNPETLQMRDKAMKILGRYAVRSDDVGLAMHDIDGYIGHLEALVDAGKLALSEETKRTEWVCLDCGAVNQCHSAPTGGGDADVVCDRCGSKDVEEGFASAIRQIIEREDTRVARLDSYAENARKILSDVMDFLDPCPRRAQGATDCACRLCRARALLDGNEISQVSDAEFSANVAAAVSRTDAGTVASLLRVSRPTVLRWAEGKNLAHQALRHSAVRALETVGVENAIGPQAKGPYPRCDALQVEHADKGMSAWQSMVAYRELARTLEQELRACLSQGTLADLQDAVKGAMVECGGGWVKLHRVNNAGNAAALLRVLAEGTVKP